MIRALAVRIANSLARAVVQVIDDSKGIQMLQLGVLEGEDVDDCERFQEYGFNSVPLAGAEAVVVFPNGDRGHPLVVAVDDRRHRPTDWDSGDTGTYNHAGLKVQLKASGTIEAGASGPFLELATKADLDALKAIFDNWITVPNDGGAALKTDLLAWSPSGTTKFKAE